MQEEEKQRDFYNLLEACAAGDLSTVKTILGKTGWCACGSDRIHIILPDLERKNTNKNKDPGSDLDFVKIKMMLVKNIKIFLKIIIFSVRKTCNFIKIITTNFAGFFWQIKYLFLKLVPSKGKVGFGSLKNYIGFVALLLTHNYLMGLR